MQSPPALPVIMRPSPSAPRDARRRGQYLADRPLELHTPPEHVPAVEGKHRPAQLTQVLVPQLVVNEVALLSVVLLAVVLEPEPAFAQPEVEPVDPASAMGDPDCACGRGNPASSTRSRRHDSP